MRGASNTDDRLSRLESQVEALSRAVERLEERLRALETTRGGAGPPAAPGEIPGPVPASEILTGVTLFGRTLLVLGGGYFLRALTESGAVAPLGGVGLGLLYAFVWMLMAERAGAAGNSLNAAFHGAAAVLVAFPLLWETTVRFEVLSPNASAICLSVVSLAAVAVAWRWRLRVFAWVTVVAATLTSFTLIIGTRQLVPFTLFLIAIAVATYWLSEHAEWPLVHWVVAGLADAAVGLVVLGLLIERSGVSRETGWTIPLALLVAFLGSFAVRLFRQKQSPGNFVIVQTGVVLTLGYGGSLLAAGPTLARVLGAGGIVAALFCYRRSLTPSSLPVRGRPYLEATAAGLLFLGSLAVPDARVAILVAAGVVLSWIGFRLERSAIALQGALFVLASAVASGLVTQGGYAYLAPGRFSWPAIDVWWVVAAVGTAGAYAIPAAGAERFWWERGRAAKLLLLGILVWALGGAILASLVPPIAGTPGVEASPAMLATVRTAVLSVSSLVLAGLARFDRFPEAASLVYPVLLMGGIKLVVEDFPHGRAATLFVALALYGGAIFVAPRLARDER